MKNLNALQRIDIYGNGYLGDEHNGAFKINNGKDFYFVIASDGDGFDHVSVTRHKNNGTNIKKCPTLDEMKKIKNIFFKDDEIVYQIFPSSDEYINEHPYCLHLWRPNNKDFSLPPHDFIDNDKEVKEQIMELDDCLCHYKIIDLDNWILLRTYITTNNMQPIKSGPTWEQACQIKEKIFGTDDACAQFMFDSTNHESSIDIYLPKDPNLLLTPASELIGYKKKR